MSSDVLVDKATKLLSSSIIPFFGRTRTDKVEDAAELFKTAAEKYKLTKQWREAGNSSVKASECYLELDRLPEAARSAKDAGFCYSKVDEVMCVEQYCRAAEFYEQCLNFTSLGAMYELIGATYAEQFMSLKAITYYEKAIETYQATDIREITIRGLQEKIGDLKLTLGDYKGAAVIYEELSKYTKYKHLQPDVVMTSILCYMAVDVVSASKAMSRTLDHKWLSSKECKFLTKLLPCVENCDIEQLQKECQDYDSQWRIAPNHTKIIVEIITNINTQKDNELL